MPEQIIVFAYDTEYCQHEADDPQKAVLFFHPSWVSEQQRLALCGQLMGVTHFCSTLFATPSIIALQSGKFLIKKLGRYVLSVGSDQSLPDWILQERFKALKSIIEFYHSDLNAIAISVDQNHENFIKKLSEILDSYVPVLQTAVTSVGSVPSLQYQNANSIVFLEALQLLEACTIHTGVPGGLILHNGRVVVSQLSSNLNLLAHLTDPYRVKISSRTATVPFHLPVGVQLFKVFVKSSLLTSLKRKPDKSEETMKKKEHKEAKKEPSRIFTVHEEEEIVRQTDQPVDLLAKESPYAKLKHRRNSKQRSEISSSLKERSKSYKANPNISVCSTPTIEKKLFHEEVTSICSGKHEPKLSPVPDLVKDVLSAKQQKEKGPEYTSMRRLSLDDQMIDLTHHSYPLPLRYYSIGLPRMNKPPTGLVRKKMYKTLTDPLYPVFRDDGRPVSKGLYNECLDQHYRDYLTANKTIDSHEEYLKTKQQERVKQAEVKPEEPVEKKVEKKMFKRPLSLPVKPMTLDLDTNTPPPVKANVIHGMTPTTPLMAKLSLLAMEEQEEAKVARNVELPPPAEKKARRKMEEIDENNATLVPCTLFVCGHENMTLFLLLDEGAEQSPELILSLWELATNNLHHIETAWNKSMDHVTQNSGSSSYSFLSLDPSWGTLRKYGPWSHDELRVVGSLHQDMLNTSNITETIVRNEESVVYGYRCGGTETYYQQSGSSSVGLPTPADLMGVIPLKARRRLERDHGIILL